MNYVTFSTEAVENEGALNGAEQETTTETTGEAETSTDINVSFKGWNQFGQSFGYMGMGMLGIFIVTCVLILTITVLNKLQSKKKNGNDA